MEEIKIRSERDAWKVLAQTLAEEELGDVNFLFDGWPKLEITIKGADFQGTIPTRIMPPILELQKELYKAHCLLKYGVDNVRKLTDDDRERLELIVKIGKGSSIFKAEFWKELNETIKAAMVDMDSRHKVILITSLALSIAAPTSWKFWLNSQEKLKEMETSVKLEQIENERIKLLTRARQSHPDVKTITKGVDEFRNSTLNKLQPQDRFHMGEEDKPALTVDGELASKVTQKPREQAIEVRLDSEFLIEEVRSGGIRGFRVKVKRVSDGKELTVTIPDGTLTKAQMETLKNNEWAKRPILMQINAKELRGNITSGTLVSAQEVKKRKGK